MSRPRNPPIPLAKAKRWFSYDPKSGDLIWRRDVLGGNGSIRLRAGTVAGCIERKSKRCKIARTVRFEGRAYQCSHIIWLLQTGTWPRPDIEIEHRDGDGLNNRWRNLREATPVQNCANRPCRSDNRSGIKGAFFRPRDGKYISRIIVHLGTFDTAEAAGAAYARAAQRLHGKFLNLNPPSDKHRQGRTRV